MPPVLRLEPGVRAQIEIRSVIADRKKITRRKKVLRKCSDGPAIIQTQTRWNTTSRNNQQSLVIHQTRRLKYYVETADDVDALRPGRKTKQS